MKFLAAIIAVVITGSVVAQQEEVVIIDRSRSHYKKERTFRKIQNTQVYKFAPLNLLAGEILFGYERQLTAKGSFDVELGPTISKIGFGLDSHFGNVYEPEIGEISGLGVVLGAGYRYYPLDDSEALNRFYVSPVFRYKVYNHKIQDYSNFLTEVKKGNETNANFLFNFGYQAWISETFSIDMYMGVGIGMRTTRDYYYETYFEDNEWKYRWLEDNRSGARYLFNAGIKVGIGTM